LAGQAWLGARPVGSDEHYEANSAGVAANWPGRTGPRHCRGQPRKKAEKQKSEGRPDLRSLRLCDFVSRRGLVA